MWGSAAVPSGSEQGIRLVQPERHMTLTERLAPYFPDGPQNALAMEWLTRWQKQGGKALSDATVESRLSELLREKPDGVRFFYNDPAREALLAEVLGLPADVRAAARERAEAVLAQGAPQAPRLVMDLSGLTPTAGEADALFQQLKRDVLGDAPVLPLTLVVDELQYDRLPRSFDDLRPRLTYVKVANGAEGRQKAVETAGETSVVASTWRHAADTRWLAIQCTRGELRYGPNDGVARVRADGRLPAAPTPADDAAALLDGAALPAVKLPDDPLILRHYIDVLGDPTRTSKVGALPARVALARALGVVAASTEAERVEAAARRERARIEKEIAEAIAKLPVPITAGGEAELERVKRRAEYAPTETVAFRIGDTVHLVGGEDLKAPRHARIQKHAVALKTTALQRLIDATRPMTLDDWRDDPLLLGVIARLAAGDARERLLLLHARAGLVLSGALKPAAPGWIEDWRAALTPLFAADPPAAQLLPVVDAEPVPWVAKAVSLRPWVFPDGKMFLPELKDCPPLYRVPPIACPFLERTQALVGFHPQSGGYLTEVSRYYGFQSPPAALVAVDATLATDPEVWLECVEASTFLGGGEQETDALWRQHTQKLQIGGELPAWHQSTLALPDGTWWRADRELATAWMALRRALRHGDAVRLHTGQVLLDLGGGLLANLELRPHARLDVVGALHLQVNDLTTKDSRGTETHKVRAALGSLTQSVDTHLAYTTGSRHDSTTRLGFALPVGITIIGFGVAVEVSFVASPLLAAGAPSASAMAATMSAAGADVIAKTVQDEEDDDD